jgi:hypothetical protein
MRLISLNLLISGTAILLAACSSGKKTAQVPSISPDPSAHSMTKEHSSKKGGKFVISGKYHLELVPEKSANETHLDLFVLNSDSHENITDAKVLGEIQSPDGQQKPISFTYDAEGKHYAGVVPGKMTGAYQLKVKVSSGNGAADGRFSFDR